MRAMQVAESGHALTLRKADIPILAHASDEVLVRVHAAGVTPTELS